MEQRDFASANANGSISHYTASAKELQQNPRLIKQVVNGRVNYYDPEKDLLYVPMGNGYRSIAGGAVEGIHPEAYLLGAGAAIRAVADVVGVEISAVTVGAIKGFGQLIGKVSGIFRSDETIDEIPSGKNNEIGNLAHNRTLHETYKAELRQNMEKPVVQHPKLQNIVDDLYKPNAKVGSGSTAAAIREELSTGNQVGGKYHYEKGELYRRGLQNWLENNPNANLGDKVIAKNLLKDLNDAMRYENRWYPKQNL